MKMLIAGRPAGSTDDLNTYSLDDFPRLVRLRDEDGYVLVEVRQSADGGVSWNSPCRDGALTVMRESDFWHYAYKVKDHRDSMEEDRRLREADRRLRSGK